MTTFLLLVLCAGFVALAFCCYMLFRNNKVYDFRCHLIDLVFMPDGDYKARLRVFNRVSYDYMLHSMKPLKLSSFYTKEEMEILVGFDSSTTVERSVATKPNSEQTPDSK